MSFLASGVSRETYKNLSIKDEPKLKHGLHFNRSSLSDGRNCEQNESGHQAILGHDLLLSDKLIERKSRSGGHTIVVQAFPTLIMYNKRWEFQDTSKKTSLDGWAIPVQCPPPLCRFVNNTSSRVKNLTSRSIHVEVSGDCSVCPPSHIGDLRRCLNVRKTSLDENPRV